MDIRKVKKLIELLEESGIAEIEIHEGEESVRISRGGLPMVTPASSLDKTAATVFTVPEHKAVASHPGANVQSPTEDYADKHHLVKAPMVGVFYASPSPEVPAFAKAGQDVRKGDVLCIIEAMKIMNQIEADISGKVVKALVENGDAVEYGQPLFAIDPA